VKTLRAIGPPLGAWLLATAVVLVTADRAGFRPFRPETWIHWDANLYLSIAREGTTLYHCAASTGETGWCGNANWFPGYPWLIALVHVAGAPRTDSAVALAWLFGAATLALLWNTFLEGRVTFANVAALLYAAFVPGLVYHYAGYPTSVLAFFTVASLWLLSRDRLIAGGLAGAAAIATYPEGLAIAPAAAVWLLLDHRRSAGERVRRALAACGLALTGLVAVVVVQWIQVGRPDGSLLISRRYYHDPHDPLAPIHNALFTVVRGHGLELHNVQYTETVVLLVTVACVLVELIVHRHTVSRTELLVAVWAATTWLLASIPADLSQYREQAVLAPLAVLVRRLPPPLLGVLVVAEAAFAVPLTVLYVHGRLL
jgi:hypothetical protein